MGLRACEAEGFSFKECKRLTRGRSDWKVVEYGGMTSMFPETDGK